MFQYAAGKSLALHKQVPYKVDVSGYAGYDLRKFELENFFDLKVEKATIEEIKSCYSSHPVKSVWNKVFPHKKIRTQGLPYEEPVLQRTLLKMYDAVSPPQTRKTYIEPYYHYNLNFFEAGEDAFIIGYFMSWKYFEKYDAEIRKDFTVRSELTEHIRPFATTILNQNSVSLHIRRSDFASKKNVLLHGIIPIEYYTNAIKEIEKHVSDINLYVFSDDIQWARDNLATRLPITFASGSITHSPVEDFYLMTCCRHNIIANSTFSWWSAYLNKNPGKIVVAPQKWYNQSSFNYKDVYPPSWKILAHT